MPMHENWLDENSNLIVKVSKKKPVRCILKDDNYIQFNESPQRKEVEKKAKLNLEKLSQQEVENHTINYMEGSNNDIRGWDLTEEIIKPRSQSSINKVKSKRANSCRSAQTKRSKRSSISVSQEKQQSSFEHIIPSQYTFTQIGIKTQKAYFIRERLEQLKGWSEQFKQERLFKVLGGMKSLIIVQGIKHPKIQPPVVYIDTPNQSYAPFSQQSHRMAQFRLKYLQKIRQSIQK